MTEMTVREGSAEVKLPNGVFYNPVQEFNRDITIAVIRNYLKLHLCEFIDKGMKIAASKSASPEPTTYVGISILEALAASGLRSVRFANEIPLVCRITANDLDPEATKLISENAERNRVSALVKPTCSDAVSLMLNSTSYADRFNVVDIDPYGTASPFLDSAVQCLYDGGLLCVTCTDMAVLCGATPGTAYGKYGGVAIKMTAQHEQGLRLLLHAIQQAASRHGKVIEPLLSLSIDFYARIFVRVWTSPGRVKRVASKMALVYSCTGCHTFHLQRLGNALEDGQAFSPARGPPVGPLCPECGSPFAVAGPLWADSLHNVPFLHDLIDTLRKLKPAAKTAAPTEALEMVDFSSDFVHHLSDAWLLHPPGMSWEGSPLIDPDGVNHNGSLVLSFSQRLVYIFRAYFSPFIFVEGVIGNTLTVVLFIKLHQQTPGRFNLYAAAISASFLLIIIFDTLLDDFFGRGLGWLTGFRINLKLDQMSSVSCKLLTYIIDCSAFIAATILSVFSIDRVCTIYYPLKLRGNHYVGMTCGIIAFIVCLGLVLFCPTLIFYDVVRGEANRTACTLTNLSLPGAQYMLLTYVIGSYTLPTLVIFISNLVVCFELLRLKSQQRCMGLSGQSDSCRVISHLGINSAFLLLMIPLVVVILLRYDTSLRTSEVPLEYAQRLAHLSRFFSSLLSLYYSNSFWIFFIFLPNFRDAVFSLLLSSPLIARSCCGSCLLRRMSKTGVRRLRSRSLITDPLRAIPAAFYGGGVHAGVALHASVLAPKRYASLPLVAIEKV